ncbi:MAG: MFS transporter, partial [Oscillospiraceae bacterium]|nr:MFS transporter [Oscillospiraceae bacterium]
MKNFFRTLFEMRVFLLLWLSQSFSTLGSSMTAYALVIWVYHQNHSALDTAFLMVCSYAPYVLFSIFAGTLSDRWDKKKIMLICDSAAAFSTLLVLLLFLTERLEIWHIYIVNAFSGLMNTVQQPASEVAVSRILPKKYYQKEGSFRYLSSSVNSIFTPVITTAITGIFGMKTVILFDLFTFLIAFLILLFFIKIPIN